MIDNGELNIDVQPQAKPLNGRDRNLSVPRAQLRDLVEHASHAARQLTNIADETCFTRRTALDLAIAAQLRRAADKLAVLVDQRRK